MIEYPTPLPLTYGEVEGSAKVMVSISFLARLSRITISLQSDPTIHTVVWIWRHPIEGYLKIDLSNSQWNHYFQNSVR